MKEVIIAFEALTAVVCVTGFIVFAWWWYVNKRATIIYVYVTLLFASEFAIHTWHFRGLGHVRNWEWNHYFIVLIFHTIILFGIVFHVLRRIVSQRRMTRKVMERYKAQPDTEFREEILIVDDNKGVLETFQRGLINYFPNIVIHTARSGEEAVEVFKDHPRVNLAIVDLNLPKMSGFDFCEIVKYTCPWTLLIAVTGYPHAYEFWNARKSGFDDYLEKPFRMKKLAEVVRLNFHKLETWKVIRDRDRKTKQQTERSKE
jgi:CheY-like chemotaxis protein